MPILICYDISSNALRQRIANKLLENGLDRINLSVFLGSISETALRKLEVQLRAWMAARYNPNDSLIILPVHDSQIYLMKVLGNNQLVPEELTGDLTTLIL